MLDVYYMISDVPCMEPRLRVPHAVLLAIVSESHFDQIGLPCQCLDQNFRLCCSELEALMARELSKCHPPRFDSHTQQNIFFFNW